VTIETVDVADPLDAAITAAGRALAELARRRLAREVRANHPDASALDIEPIDTGGHSVLRVVDARGAVLVDSDEDDLDWDAEVMTDLITVERYSGVRPGPDGTLTIELGGEPAAADLLSRVPHRPGEVTAADLRAVADLLDSFPGLTPLRSVLLSARGGRTSLVARCTDDPATDSTGIVDAWAFALDAQAVNGGPRPGPHAASVTEYHVRRVLSAVDVTVYGHATTTAPAGATFTVALRGGRVAEVTDALLQEACWWLKECGADLTGRTRWEIVQEVDVQYDGGWDVFVRQSTAAAGE
jgi:urease gamma subunit